MLITAGMGKIGLSGVLLQGRMNCHREGGDVGVTGGVKGGTMGGGLGHRFPGRLRVTVYNGLLRSNKLPHELHSVSASLVPLHAEVQTYA